MSCYYRPLLGAPQMCSAAAVRFAGTRFWFDRVQVIDRHGPNRIIPVSEVPADIMTRWTARRADIAGLDLSRPVIMGILNVTPDSFSDGGQFDDIARAVGHATQMRDAGADLIDIGGESTRPGADFVPVDVEIERTVPVIAALSDVLGRPVSLDTRKSAVADAGLRAGAHIVNDVSGFTFDPDLISVCVRHQVPVCVMHAQGDPKTMQDAPHYDHVVGDVYDFLETQIDRLVAAGIPHSQIIADPGIGFGKTLDHNLQLLNHIGVFHTLGVPILLGVSRKGMIKTIGQAPEAAQRVPGSVAVALAALEQGIQIFRVHDVAETKQAFDLWQAVQTGEWHGA